AQGDDDCVIQIRRRFGRVVPGVHFLDHSDGLIFFMTDHPDDRIALFIDGANLYSAARALNCDLDFKKLSQRFTGEGRLIRAYYYTAVIEGEEFSPIRPLVDWLDYNGFTVVTKPVKRYVDAQGHSRTKGNMDMEIAVDMLELAPRLDHAVLFSGDGDFR